MLKRRSLLGAFLILIMLAACTHRLPEKDSLLIVMGGRHRKAVALHVRIQGGLMMFPPFKAYQAYRPFSFNLRPGHCIQMPVYSQDGEKMAYGMACYRHGILALYPSHYHWRAKKAMLHLDKTRLWRKGFHYRKWRRQGYLRFKNVGIFVKYRDVS